MPEGMETMMDKTELGRGWPPLLGSAIAMIAGIGCLPYYTAGLFIPSLQHDFGWSRAAISLGSSILALGQVFLVPFIGMLVDKIDARKLVPPGIFGVAIAFGWLTQLKGNLPEFYAAMSLMAVSGSFATGATLSRIVAETFDVSRGAALGLVMAGTGVGAAIGSPLVAMVISAYGWRAGYVAEGLFALAVTPLIWRLVRAKGVRKVVETKSLSGASFGEAIRRPVYWFMACAFFFISLGSAGLIIHFTPLLIDRGVDPGSAVRTASIIGLCVSASRILTGFMIDRIFAPRVAAALMLTAACGYVAFLVGGSNWAFFGAISIGISYGAEMDLISFLVSRYFGLRRYGRLYGLMYSLTLIGTFLSPILYGWTKDTYDTYVPMIAVAIGLLSLSAAIFALLPAFPRTASAEDAAATPVPPDILFNS